MLTACKGSRHSGNPGFDGNVHGDPKDVTDPMVEGRRSAAQRAMAGKAPRRGDHDLS
jgi:hypothetical protein